MKRILLLATLIFMQLSMFSQNTNWINEIDMDPYNGAYNMSRPIDVVVDNDGAIWTSGMFGEVTKYYNYIYTYYSLDSANYPATITRDLAYYNNELYAATDTGILKFNGSTWDIYLTQSSGLHSNYVAGFDIKNDKIYARTDSTLNIYDMSSGDFTYVNLHTFYNHWYTTSVKKAVFVDDNENIYVGDTNCVLLVNNDSVVDIYLASWNNNYNISDIKKTSSGQLYAQTPHLMYKLIGNELIEIETYLNMEYSGHWPMSSGSRNIFIEGDTVYYWGDALVKIYNNEYKVYYNPGVGNTVFISNFNGIIFKDINGNFCVRNNGDYYKIVDFDLYCDLEGLTPDNYQHLDINNVNAGFKHRGVMFYNVGKPDYEVPKGSGKHSNYASGLWITAEDEYSLMYTAATQENASGYDFFPGPLNDDAEADSMYAYQYNKVWKVNRLDIEEMHYRYENGLINQPGYHIPKDILTWPANGNTSLGYSQNIAPYYDANGDNIYDVFAGDYPLIHGDQEIFSIFNDNLTEHTETQGARLGIEVQNSFYAYYCPNANDSSEAINNTTYLYYKIINKSNKTFLKTNIGIFSDTYIGYKFDDLVGSNVDLKSYYFYNYGADEDTTNDYNTYGENPPALSYTFLKGAEADNADWKDNDNDGQIDEVGETCDFNHFLSFMCCGGPVIGDANYKTDYFYYNQAKWQNGEHQTYGGNGYNPGSDTIADFAYPGNSDSNNFGTHGIDPGFPWYDTTKGHKVGIGSFGPFTFEAGDTVEFTVAIVWSRDTTNTVDSNNVQKLFTDIENIHYWFDNNIDISCLELDTSSIGISTVNKNINFDIYPNPVKDVLFLDYSDYNDAKYRITDINGRILSEAEITNNRTAINTKDFAKGVYIITIYKDNDILSRKFVK